MKMVARVLLLLGFVLSQGHEPPPEAVAPVFRVDADAVDQHVIRAEHQHQCGQAVPQTVGLVCAAGVFIFGDLAGQRISGKPARP